MPAVPLAPGVHPLGIGGRRDGLLWVPDGVATPGPVLLWLHGAGGDATGTVRLIEAPARRAGVPLLVPESRLATWDVIARGFGPDVAFLDAALGRAFDLLAVDPDRVAIGGFSDGASYALSLGLANGDLFRAILAFSPGFAAPSDAVGRPAVFVSHGVADAVLPIGPCSRRLVPRLRRAGYDVRYEEFEGGHVIPEAVAEAALRLLGPG
ncbi:alpha/beta hydrolase [Roseomonas sp. CCTCC AB2023176]|uniref:alpha/beta hydrolase n=1 Tax=Roseomonas sp. CCTCC AB2023176 TaxID=3342640 RepID=UPI0035D5F662